MSEKKELIQLDACIREMINTTAFTAELGNGHNITAYFPRGSKQAAGLSSGDVVVVELSPYDMSKGRILSKHAEGKYDES